MTLAHLQLVQNHFPTVGFGIGVGLFLIALPVKSEPLKQVSLGIFFIIALLTIIVYLSGNAADLAIAKLPGVSERWLESPCSCRPLDCHLRTDGKSQQPGR